MSEPKGRYDPAPTTLAPSPENGQVPAPAPTPEGQPGLQLPKGAIQLPPSMVQRLTRILQTDPHVHDVLYAFIEGKGETGPYSLVVPVVLLLRPQPGQS